MPFIPIVRRALLLTFSVVCLFVSSASAQVASESMSAPLPPEYQIHADGSVSQRVCFNWSCSLRQTMTFSAAEMAGVAEQMNMCQGDGFRERAQRMRIGIWQMELLAQKYQPLLSNDRAVNTTDVNVEGRMDCVDNATNTGTYLSILLELGLLSGWSLDSHKVRDLLSFDVHWTAVVIDEKDKNAWAVDSWFRGNGNLPFVVPLSAWQRGKAGWDEPLSQLNPYPQYTSQLCAAPGLESSPRQAARARPFSG